MTRMLSTANTEPTPTPTPTLYSYSYSYSCSCSMGNCVEVPEYEYEYEFRCIPSGLHSCSRLLNALLGFRFCSAAEHQGKTRCRTIVVITRGSVTETSLMSRPRGVILGIMHAAWALPTTVRSRYPRMCASPICCANRLKQPQPRAHPVLLAIQMSDTCIQSTRCAWVARTVMAAMPTAATSRKRMCSLVIQMPGLRRLIRCAVTLC